MAFDDKKIDQILELDLKDLGKIQGSNILSRTENSIIPLYSSDVYMKAVED
jgi:hypothetical protein